jgi:hypothetical protein
MDFYFPKRIGKQEREGKKTLRSKKKTQQGVDFMKFTFWQLFTGLKIIQELRRKLDPKILQNFI